MCVCVLTPFFFFNINEKWHTPNTLNGLACTRNSLPAHSAPIGQIVKEGRHVNWVNSKFAQMRIYWSGATIKGYLLVAIAPLPTRPSCNSYSVAKFIYLYVCVCVCVCVCQREEPDVLLVSCPCDGPVRAPAPYGTVRYGVRSYAHNWHDFVKLQ